MKIRNNNPLDLEGQDGERITVNVVATGTVYAVSYDLDGTAAPLPPTFSFTLNKAANNPSILVLFFIFSNSGGGVYSLTVTGSAGGDTSHFSETQFHDQATDSIAYAFDIV